MGKLIMLYTKEDLEQAYIEGYNSACDELKVCQKIVMNIHQKMNVTIIWKAALIIKNNMLQYR